MLPGKGHCHLLRFLTVNPPEVAGFKSKGSRYYPYLSVSGHSRYFLGRAFCCMIFLKVYLQRGMLEVQFYHHSQLILMEWDFFLEFDEIC